jgi:two-component SAPR family response regulator
VLQALAWGAYLIDDTGKERAYFKEAWDQFILQGDRRSSIEVCLDNLLYRDSELSEQERGRALFYMEQTAKLNPIFQAFTKLISEWGSGQKLNWQKIDLTYLYLNAIHMSYHHYVMCLIRCVEYRLQSKLPVEPSLWSQLDHAQQTYGSDLILQFQLGTLRYTQAVLQGDTDLADSLFYKMMAWQELTRNPDQAAWLNQKQVKKYRTPHHPSSDNGSHEREWGIRCFGGMTFTLNGMEVKGLKWKRKKALELYIYLLTQKDYSAPKEQIMETLLGQGNPDKMNNQLYVILHQLKQTLKQELHLQSHVLIKDGMIRLNMGLIHSYDLEQYRLSIQTAKRLWNKDKALAITYFEQARTLYGNFVPEMPYIDWLDSFREVLVNKQAGILNKLARYYRDQGQYERAEAAYYQWIDIQPTDEEAYKELKELLVTRGRKQEAQSLQRKWEKLFNDEVEQPSASPVRKSLKKKALI